MRLTKSAITMLLSAYQAVFKDVYLKGLASAVVLTATLGTSAQVAPALDIWNQEGALITVDELLQETSGETITTDKDILITGDNGQIVIENGSKLLQNGDITINNNALVNHHWRTTSKRYYSFNWYG